VGSAGFNIFGCCVCKPLPGNTKSALLFAQCFFIPQAWVNKFCLAKIQPLVAVVPLGLNLKIQKMPCSSRSAFLFRKLKKASFLRLLHKKTRSGERILCFK